MAEAEEEDIALGIVALLRVAVPGGAPETARDASAAIRAALAAAPDFVRALADSLERPPVADFSAVTRAEGALEPGALAFMIAWLGAARRADPARHWFHYWSSELLRAAIPRTGISGRGARLRLELEQRITLGINLRGRRDEEFVAACRQVDRAEAEPAEGPALAALRLVLACSSFCAGDLERSLALAGEGGADPALCLALLAGAYYGRARLAEHWPALAAERRGR